MKWCLGDKAVGCGDSEKACYSGGETEKEEIPVETGWFAEGEFGSLSNEG